MRARLVRLGAVLAVAGVAGVSSLSPVAAAAVAHPITLAQLESAPVPSLCGHPAGRLVNGALPGILAGAGKVVLAASAAHHSSSVLAFGDLNGDGVRDAAVVVLCTNAGKSRPASVQLYTSGAKRLGGLSLDTYTHRGTDIVASLTILHRQVYVHFSANERGDATGTASLDYATRLAVSGGKVVAGHTISYGEDYIADRLAGDARSGNRKAALALATPSVVGQLFATQAHPGIADLYGCQGTPTRDRSWGVALDSFVSFVPSLTYPTWMLTNERYCLGLTPGEKYWTLVRLKHLGWRKWRADFFLQAKAVR